MKRTNKRMTKLNFNKTTIVRLNQLSKIYGGNNNTGQGEAVLEPGTEHPPVTETIDKM